MNQTPDKSLQAYNTFGFKVKAKQYYIIDSLNTLEKILRKCYADELFILGGGSNILLTGDLNQTVLHIKLKGIALLEENDHEVIIRAQAGENWHEFVRYCVAHDYGGIENLSLIPGNVGTAPIQNIGAYGVELQDSFVACEAINRQTLERKTFKKEDCRFGYRNSVFKNVLKNQYIITNVTFKLHKPPHQLHTSYGSLKRELQTMGVKHPTITNISDAVINIRQAKLPDPQKIGNSGSFFKNPIINETEFDKLQENFPELPYYKISDNHYKIPAGWLIDQAGFKGYRSGDAGVHQHQALVLVNYGKATGKQILKLAHKIQCAITAKYNLHLEMEVNIIK